MDTLQDKKTSVFLFFFGLGLTANVNQILIIDKIFWGNPENDRC